LVDDFLEFVEEVFSKLQPSPLPDAPRHSKAWTRETYRQRRMGKVGVVTQSRYPSRP